MLYPHCRGPGPVTVQGQLSFSSFWGWLNEYQKVLVARVIKNKLPLCGGSVALRQLKPIHKSSIKRGRKVVFKSKSFKLNITNWPCFVTKKKLVWPTNKADLGVCYQLLCTNLGDEILCILSANHNIHRENGVYQQWTRYALKSKRVSEMHFPAIRRSKFTDIGNSRKNSIFRKKRL